MTERLTDKRTIVGVPFYDGEGQPVLEACLANIDMCLNKLGVDAKIVVGINGPRVQQGLEPLSYQLDRSKYNAEIHFVRTAPGIVAASQAIGAYAAEEGHERIFLTDVDISRLPNALANLWKDGNRAISGANYSTYPIEVLLASGLTFAPEELAIMKIFEADKHPQAREFTHPHRPKNRLKGSLLLVETRLIKSMFGGQGITSDSRMNRRISDDDRQLVPTAAFMHYARVDVTDHIQARLRHFRAAEAESDLEGFSKKSLMYSPKTAEEIARKILDKYPDAIDVASFFLLQCALRHLVVKICQQISKGEKFDPKVLSTPVQSVDLNRDVHTYNEAEQQMKAFLQGVDWESLESPVTRGSGTTNNNQSRVPIDLEPFLRSDRGKKIILEHLGIDDKVKV
jgi:hypothetical protein